MKPHATTTADQRKDPPPQKAWSDWRSSGRIMVVDDEDTVRTVIDEALTRVGFTVTGASSGLKAIEAFERESGRFDLVVLDLKIPAMDPAEVVRRLRAVRPDVKILLMSGYERQKAHESALSLQLSGFLPKPFTLEEMTSKVRSVLAS